MLDQNQTSETSVTQDQSGNNVPSSFREAAGEAWDKATQESDSTPETEEKPEVETSPTEAEKPKAAEAKPKDTSNFDWDKYPEAKKHYDETQTRYKNLESLFGRKTTEWKGIEEKLKDFETKAKQFDQLDQLYRTNAGFRKAFYEATGRTQPEMEVDPSLKEDPLFRHIQSIQQQNQELRNQVQAILQERGQQAQMAKQAQIENEINAETQKATAEYKSFFGKEPSQEDMGKIYQFMADNRVYDGRSAARALFMEEAMNARVQKALEEQMAKKPIATKTSTVRARAGSNSEPKSFRDFLGEQIDELGMFS